MPWGVTKDKTLDSLKNKSLEARKIFAEVANAALSDGKSEEYSIRAGLAAVSNYENKRKKLAKAALDEQKRKKTEDTSQDNLPEHLKVLLQAKELKKQQQIESELAENNALKEKVLSIVEECTEIPEIKEMYFDADGKLIVELQDGTKLRSKNSLPSNYITQHVSVAAQYPFFDWIQFNNDPDIPDSDKLPGMLFWNEFEDCLDVVQSDGTSLQLGLENYIQVKNNTLQDIPNGSVVMFSGVDLEEIPTCTLILSSGEIDPLFIIGVLTTDIPAGQIGRATVFGKVRNLDTSAYNQGDLLWVSTTTPGQLTNVKPSAPNPAISVAAVLKVHATDGVLLVRPVIYPRLFYGVFNSSQTQVPIAINTPYAVTLNETEFSSGVVLQNSSEIKVLHAGLYSFDFRVQVTSSNSSQKNIYIWARRNGVDIPNTATKVTLVGNGVEAAPSWNFMRSMDIDDVFQIMYAVDNTAMSISAPLQTAFCPSTPSVTLRVSRFDL